MRFEHFLCLTFLLFQPELSWAGELRTLSGNWRGAGQVSSFDGVNRDVRCRLEVLEQETGRIDFQGVCADPAGAQSFGVYFKILDGEASGGRLSMHGAEVEPFLKGRQVKDGFWLEGTYRNEIIRIALDHSDDTITMTSSRFRAEQSEVVSVTYDRR